MLGPIETLLADALRPALPPGTELVTGPATTAPAKPRLQVLARALARRPAPPGEPPRDPAPSWLSRRDRLTPDAPPPGGDGRSFTLPAGAFPVLEEVQAPPGRIAARGDDYLLEGRTLRFMAPPAGPVEAVTRGGPARGWRDRSPATARLDLVAMAPDAAGADALLATALAAGLAALVGQEAVTLAWRDQPGLRVRLLGIGATLLGFRRAAEAVGEARWVRATAGIRLRGELETMVALGAAPEPGVIGAVETDLAVLPGARRSRIVVDGRGGR